MIIHTVRNAPVLTCFGMIICLYLFSNVTASYIEFGTRNFAVAMVFYGMVSIMFTHQFFREIRKSTIRFVKHELNEHPNLRDDIDLL